VDLERAAENRDVPIRPAATVLLVHDDPEGLEVLMLRRATKAAFAGGMYVFPGGRVDPGDGDMEIESFCEGLDDCAASARLGIDQGGLSYWVAAVRETFEEAGVIVGRRRDGSHLELSAEERRAVHAGELSMAQLCRRHDLVLDLGRVPYVAHWVTPRGEIRRFDTRFFLAAVPGNQDSLHDEMETVESRWLRPASALAEMAAGSFMMLPPTIASLEWLSTFDDVESALDAARALPSPPRIEPKLRFDDVGNVTGVAMPGEADYDELD
jgi:8-oxo-dGTP pyrophosphatase MutT (NUDIX family)